MAGKRSGAPPPGGVYNPQLVKTEKTEAEKIYLMTETSDSMKKAQEKLFPLNPPQRQIRLKAMFSAPRGVTPQRRNENFYKYLITDIGAYEVKSKTSFGPSVALEKIFIKKDQIHESTKNAHMLYAAQNLQFVKVYAKLVLVFETAPLKNSNVNNMAMCLVTSRARWFAANLIRFPTSPQVMAAQLIRNHARIYSEENKETHEAAAYQNSVKRLLYCCPGMERALVPEGHMPIENHMRMSWYRIRKRVLERMYEETQKVYRTQNETNFLKNMPFGIKTIADLLKEIKDLIDECDALWDKEKAGEIELSDGPDMEEEEDMEFDDSMRGQVQHEQRERTAPSNGLMQLQQQQSLLLPGPSVTLPPAASRMNQLYNHTLEQRKKQASTLASLGPQMGMRAPPSGSFPHGGMHPSGGRGATLPRMTPISTSGERGGVKMQMRRDLLMDTPSVLPSTSTNLIRRGAISREGIPLQQSAPPQTNLPSLSHSIPLQQNVQPPPIAPPPSTPHALPTAPSPSVPPTAPLPTTPHAMPSALPQLQSTTPHVIPSSHSSSLQLMAMGTDGVMQHLPTIVYLQNTENGLVQVSPPTPSPQIFMSIPSTGGRRARSLSMGKRRMSLPRQELKRRRAGYEESSEDSDEEEKRLRAKEIRVLDEKKKKREKEREEKEKREEREKEEREEEEFRKKEEEDKKKKEEEERKKEEEEKKQKEEEDRKKEEEDRQKKEEEDRLEMEKMRKEQELKMEAERKKKEEEDAAKEAEEARVEEKDEYEASDENEVEEGEEEMRVLAEDSGDESEKEEGMESEDEVVAESVVNEEIEEDREKEKESGVRESRPPIVVRTEGADSDIEVVFEGSGEKRQMSGEYCEIVSEVVTVKKESNETVDKEVIFLNQKKGMRSLPSNKLGTTSDKRRSFDQSINLDKVKKENENEKDKEKEGTLEDACHQPAPTTPLQTVKREEKEPKIESNSENTELTEVKNEVKEEEEEKEEEKDENENEEEQEDEAMVTMIERRNGEDEERIEDTLNRSGELDFLTAGEDEETERSRNVLEAMTQEESSQIPFILANSDAAVTPLLPIEESPIEKTTQSSPTQTASPPLVTPPIEEKEKEGEMEIERATVPMIGDESEKRMSTPSPRPPPISVSSQSGNTGCGERIPRLQTRLSAQQIEMINNVDSLCMPYVKGFQRIGLKDAEKEKEKMDEKEGEVEVIKELPLVETDSHVLKFHSMRGIAAVLSEDRRSAIRDEEVDSCSKALVYTNRPLYKGERVTLTVIETCAAWKGRIRLGLTTKNPLSYASRNEIPKFRETENDHDNISYFYDSGAMNNVKKGTVLEVELTEKGDVLNYWFDGMSMGVMGGGLQIARPMWLMVDIYGYVKGIQIVDSAFPPQEAHGIDVPSGNEMALVLKTETNEESMASENMAMKKEEVSTQENEEGMEKQIGETETAPIEKKRGGEEGMEEDKDVSGDKGEEETVVEEESVMEEGIGEEETTGKRMREGEEKTVDGEGLEEEEPPMKKMRMEGESSDEAENEQGKEETKAKDGLDTVEMEEKENEEPAVESVEGIEEGEEKSDGDEMANVDENGMKEMEENGEEGKDIDEEGDIERAEEEEMVKDTEEEKEEEGDVMGVTEDGEEREKVVNEVVNVKEGDEEKVEEAMEDSIDTRDIEVSLVIQKSIEAEEEVKETETGIPVESTEEEKMEMREELAVVPPFPPLPLRRRSLFGAGCLPFDRTLEAKITHGTEDEEEEEKMEVDEVEEVAPIRRRSLFGPGSISFNHLLNQIHDKE